MNKPKPVAQVVAVYPEGPDGHGVNWLTGNRPKPGDLLYLAKDVSQEQTTIISENMRRTIEQALTGAEADADNVPIWWTPDLECLLNELIGKPFKRCATCGYVGHEDPVKGCPSCGFDDMRTLTQTSDQHEILARLLATDVAKQIFFHLDDGQGTATNDGLAWLAARAALGEKAGKRPMFWVRLRSDGGYEGPIHNAVIEEVRKLSGAWHPLYLHSDPMRAKAEEHRDGRLAALEESATLKGERAALVRLLVECDKVLSTLDGESTDEQTMLERLRAQILAATTQHRPQEASLLSVRSSLGSGL